MAEKLASLLKEIRQPCTCGPGESLGCMPVIQAARTARLLIVGQAPGRKAQDSGTPWNDPSGDRLRDWLQMDRDTFYDPARVAIIPMGLCYPGKGKSGDLPPRTECAPRWHPRLFAALPDIRLTLLIGQYAQAHYLGPLLPGGKPGKLADTVAGWHQFLPRYFPLPHPSPRNLAWFKHHPWFGEEVLPALALEVKKALD